MPASRYITNTPAVVDRHTGVGSFHGNHTTKLVLISVGPGRGGGGTGICLEPCGGVSTLFSTRHLVFSNCIHGALTVTVV